MDMMLYACCLKNLKDYYSRKCTLNQSNEKFWNFSITNGMKIIEFQGLHFMV